ncbi:MAG: hypothetical protein O9346_01925 [Leptospiraceae bacterium]|nr:hypothetical protein [Leptospiraceae bacterium]
MTDNLCGGYMPMSVTIRTNARDIYKQQQAIIKNQLPFAAAKTINDVLYLGQRDIRENLSKDFTLRNKWTQSGIRVEKADKNKLSGIIGSKDSYLKKQQEGSTLTPAEGRNIPFGIKSSKTDKIPRALFPSKLGLGTDSPTKVRGKEPFIITQGSKKRRSRSVGAKRDRRRRARKKYAGLTFSEVKQSKRENRFTGIFIRTRKGKSGLKLLYAIVPKVKIDKVDIIDKPFQKVVKANMEQRFEENLLNAIRTAK